jgi:hypothetical protein
MKTYTVEFFVAGIPFAALTSVAHKVGILENDGRNLRFRRYSELDGASPQMDVLLRAVADALVPPAEASRAAVAATKV